MKSIILITGTPGVGKTTIAMELSKRLNCDYINIADYALKKHYIIGFDGKLKSYIIDIEKVRDDLDKLSEDRCLIVDSHIVEVVPREKVKKVIVLRLNPKILEKRLKERNYPEEKIRINVESELVDVCLVDCINYFDKEVIYEIDTTNKKITEIIDLTLEAIEKDLSQIGVVDWLSDLNF